MNQVGNVLAAVGQFPQDEPVLERAAEIACAHAATLTIVHVVDGFCESTAGDLTSIQHQIQLMARERIEAAVEKLQTSVPETAIRIEIGSPYLRVITVANEINADLVVIRAHQSDSILEKIIGSTTDRVIRVSRAPVLVVKRPVKHAYQGVVAAIDTADNSAAIVPFVAALFTPAELSLIHVVQIPHQFKAAMLRSGSGQSVTAYRDALIGRAKVYLRDLADSLINRPSQIATRTVIGDPATALVRATWNPKVDLIALGPGSTSTIRRALLGSVTRRVLRTATCDVLVCRPTSQEVGE